MVIESNWIDWDDEEWVEHKPTNRPEIVTEGSDILRDIEEWDTHYFDDSYSKFFDLNKKYTYIPDYSVIYRKLNLTRLARKMYGIPEDFKGDLYLAKKR